jgi:hypothetical protein
VELCGNCDGWVQYRTGEDGSITVLVPRRCRNHHALVRGTYLIGFRSAQLEGPFGGIPPHRTVICLVCEAEGKPGATMAFEYPQ